MALTQFMMILFGEGQHVFSGIGSQIHVGKVG